MLPRSNTVIRRAMVRLSLQVPALASAYRLTNDRTYAAHATRHLRAWFVDNATRMNPHLLYSQAIHGRVTGRGIGIRDSKAPAAHLPVSADAWSAFLRRVKG